MDCLKDPACHRDVDEIGDPRSLEMGDDMAGEPDKEPGVEFIWDVDLTEDVGEKGGTCFVKDEFERQAAASEGVANHRKAAAS